MAKESANVFSSLGASNHAVGGERMEFDLYCTHPRAVEELLKLETLPERIWEPCDGLGHVSTVLSANGHKVRRSDITSRGRDIEELDFLKYDGVWDGAIVTNPPYSCATDMIRKALSVVADGCKVVMWLRILFLESKERQRLFAEFPPKRVWVSSTRIPCSNRDGEFRPSAQGYAWFVWEKGYGGETALGWF